MRTRVKICGITRVQDAQTAVACGADAIGLVFYSPSPRCVSIAQAQAVVGALAPFVQVVGLFVDAQAQTVRQVLDRVRIDMLQFHGAETEAQCVAYAKPYIKAVRVQPETSIMAVAACYPSASGLLLDAYVADAPGGTGASFNWSQIPQNCAKPLILAGGLQPNNVQQAIRAAPVYAVDVSSGVERAKGVKDATKIRAFMQGVADV